MAVTMEPPDCIVWAAVMLSRHVSFCCQPGWPMRGASLSGEVPQPVHGSPGLVALQPVIAGRFPTDGRLVMFQQPGNPGLAIFGFLQDVNLVLFLSGKLGMAHRSVISFAARYTTLLPQLALWQNG